MSDTTTTPPAAPAVPAASPARASLTIQALLSVVVAIVFALVFLGAFVTGDAGLKHDLGEVLKALVYGVFGYYFGSSIGSRLKNGDAAGGEPGNG